MRNPDAFYEYNSGMYVCGACLENDLNATRVSYLVEDERVYQGMFTRLPAGEPYQCDSCLHQSPEYDELD